MPPKRNKRGDADPFWGWVHEIWNIDSIREEHVKSAYRMNQIACVPGKCKKNCRQNPFCLNGLGENPWLKSSTYDALDSSTGDECRPRQKGDLVGLRNLGATCYVNAFLQLWFHNRAFRSAIYEWRGEPSAESSSDEGAYPTTTCGLLQYIFASLELSEMSIVDPSPLVRKLMLNNLEQQDAQEFGKLFMNLLGSLPDDTSLTSCSASSNALLRRRIQEIFSGVCQYVTRCHSCNTLSTANSSYTEIDAPVEGKRSLADALADYLKEEVLDGDNRYHCEICNAKQKASRRIQLKSVPLVLHVQLLRYVYDRKAGQKKKICSSIQFPEVLCMGPYLGKSDDSDVYDLSAVLVHSGSGAYSGHYTAHIRMNVAGTNPSNGQEKSATAHVVSEMSPQDQQCSGSCDWYKFNDETIEPISSPRAELTKEETDGQGEVKSQKVPKGYISSRNAYMLVYKRRLCDTELQYETAAAPLHIRSIVEKESKAFVATTAEIEIQAKQKRESEAAVRNHVATSYRKLFTSSDALSMPSPEGTAAVSLQWLLQWLKNPEAAVKIDNRPFLCQHGNIKVDEVANLKYVSQVGASILYEKYGAHAPLDLTMTCSECVKRICSYKKMQTQVANDLQLISDCLKPEGNVPLSECYLVGRSSLRHLKTLMTRPLLKEGCQFAAAALQVQQDGRPGGQSGDHGADEVGDSSCSLSSGSAVVFNDDLLCSHSCLAIDEKTRMVVVPAVWEVLKTYFPAAPEFLADSQPCEQCLAAEAAAKESAARHRSAALELRSMLCDCLGNKKRPQAFDDPEVYLVSRTFLESLKTFASSAKRTEAPALQISTGQLLCTHGNLSADPTDSSTVVPLWPHEWQTLWKHFGECEKAICVTRNGPPAGAPGSLDRTGCTISPEVCQECLSARVASMNSQRCTYHSARLYVTRIRGSRPRTSEQKGSDNEGAASDSNSDADYPGAGASDESARKRQKTVCASDGSSQPTGTAHVRRSNRRCRTRDDWEVAVSSSMTLKQLKVELMKHFAVAPFDQTLLLEGRVLRPDDATLHDLRIEPSSVLQLQIDEAGIDEDNDLEALLVRGGLQEEGFKGTGLLTHN